MTNVYFNDVNLAITPGLTVLSRNPYELPRRELKTAPVARRNKSAISGSFFVEKDLKIEVSVPAPDRVSVDLAIDTLKGICAAESGNLDMDVGGTLRRWVATLESITFTQVKGGFAQLMLNFKATEPIGKDAGSSVLLANTTITGNSIDSAITPQGSANQRPIITAIINSVTGATGAAMGIFNPETTQGVTVTWNWVVGDILVVDGEAELVTINSVLTAYSGKIPTWGSGPHNIRYTDTGPSLRNITLSAIYYRRNL